MQGAGGAPGQWGPWPSVILAPIAEGREGHLAFTKWT